MLYFNQVCPSDDILQPGESHFGQIFAYFLCQESKIIHYIFIVSAETFAEFGVLGGHAYGTGVGVAFAHHDASQHNQCGGTETEFFRTQQGHVDNIPSGFQLSVHLQFHLSAESVQHQGLLRLAQSYFGRDTCIPHTRCRRRAGSSFRSRNDNQVGFRFGHSGGNGSHAAFGYQFHTDSCLWVYVFQVEYQLGQIFDGINVMVGWRGNERDARNGVAGFGNHLIYLESRQLSSFSRLGALGHLYLDLFGMDQVFGGNSEASRCYLLGLAAK